MRQASADSEDAALPVEPARLDEVMLAMDVVDTLRHQQDLVEHALSEELRDAALITRIRTIYANQGIEVSDAIIAEGVEALKKDRFNYQPPPPSFRIRLARLYVRRGTWAKRIAVLAVLGLAGWLVYDIRGDLAERSHGAETRALVDDVRQRIDSAATRLAGLERDVRSLSVPAALGSAGQRRYEALAGDNTRAGQAIQRARAGMAGVPDTTQARDRADVERALAALSPPLAEAEQALQRATSSLGELRQLVGLSESLNRVEARFAGLSLVAAADVEVRTLHQQAGQALAAGDVATARARIDRLETIANAVNLSYELRIVSRPDEQTGVWRQPADNPRARNYYIIVDAVGADGRPLALPITSEEDQSTQTVSTFGIRVPESVFEAIRADKMANGLVDDPLFAVKRRGALEPEYRRAVAGGMITRW